MVAAFYCCGRFLFDWGTDACAIHSLKNQPGLQRSGKKVGLIEKILPARCRYTFE